jgi:hypothetical protein
MKALSAPLLSSALLLGLSGPASADQPGWWHLCGDCRSEEQFRDAALNAPAPDGLLFVSSSSSRESRAFERTNRWEAFGSGFVPVRNVSALTITDEDRQALALAMERGSDHIAVLERQLLTREYNIDHQPRSLLDDIRHGYLDRRVLTSAWRHLQDTLHFPTAAAVGQTLEIDLLGISIEGIGQVGQLRHLPLRVVIEYEDGSLIDTMIRADSSDYFNLSMRDATRSSIPLVDPMGPVFEIDVAWLENRRFGFSKPSQGAMDSFRNWLDTLERAHGLSCSASEIGSGMHFDCVRGG